MKSKQVLSAGLAALACAALPAAAVAQDQRCISRAESQSVVAHLMPSLLSSAAKRCGPRLGNDAYLARNANALTAKLQPLSQQSWPAAKRALERQSGTALPENETFLELGRLAIAEQVTNKMDAQACTITDQLLEQLAPLPPQNLASVFALFLEAGVNNQKDAAFRICETQDG